MASCSQPDRSDTFRLEETVIISFTIVHLGARTTSGEEQRMLYGFFLQLKTWLIFSISLVCVQYKICNTEISADLVRDKLSRKSITKSAGPDRIHSGLLKEAGEDLAKHIQTL